MHWGVGALFMIEDFRSKDDNDTSRRYSGYSSLILLVESLETPIVTEAFQINNPWDVPEGLTREFSSNPIEALSSIGAQFGPPRRIRALYRFRAACIDKGVVTVSYPIAILEEKGAEKIGT